jgi:acyl carrier protein
MEVETSEARVTRLVLEYCVRAPDSRPLDAGLVLKEQLGIESMSLVSLLVRLGDELGIDIAELDLELGNIKTMGDLLRVAQMLSDTKVSA